MKKIVVVGSINNDLVIEVDKAPVMGETVFGRDFIQVFGGKGANQSVAAARLGAQVMFIGAVGNDDFGKALIKNLTDNNVKTDCMKIVDDKPTGTAIIILCENDNYIVVDLGANMSLDKTLIDNASEFIKEADMVLLQLEIPLETALYVIKLCNSLSVPVLLNPAPAPAIPFDKELLGMVSYLTPNETETYTLTGIMPSTPDEAIKAAKRLTRLGANQIAITLGSLGCVYGSGDNFNYIPAVKVETVVDSTAAGDSFSAALAVAITEGKTFEEAVKFATKVGAITVTRKGAQPSLPYRHEIN